MENYTLNDALEDLDALATRPLAGDQRVDAVLRLRNFVQELATLVKSVEQAGVTVEDDQ